MRRTFLRSFEPAGPVSGATVDLEVSDIEDAGIREVLQTPGAACGAWSIGHGDAKASIGRYLDFYNRRRPRRRPHSSLDGMTPDQVYFPPLPIRSAA